MVIKRRIFEQINRYAREFPVLAVLGPRQVGKTTLVKMFARNLRISAHYLDLEKTSDLRRLKFDAEQYLAVYSDECVIVDEIQRMPELFPLLRALVDDERRPARFVLTGSASPELLQGASESLAGRIYYFYLHPVGLHELPGNLSIRRHWLRGGFPKALTLRNNELASGWLEAFITTYIERDLPMLFDVRFSTVLMRKLWGMLAHLHGSILNAEKLGASLDVTGTTIKRYLDFLEGAFIIRRLPPYYVNIGKRLVKSPKIYVCDSGILHQLLRISSEKDLLGHPSVGSSWEGYVISQIVYALPPRFNAYYYRTQAGAECDLVLVHGHTIMACIEIKLSKAPQPTRGFYNAIADLGSTKNFMICHTEKEYTNRNKVTVTNASSFVKKHLPKL